MTRPAEQSRVAGGLGPVVNSRQHPDMLPVFAPHAMLEAGRKGGGKGRGG